MNELPDVSLPVDPSSDNVTTVAPAAPVAEVSAVAADAVSKKKRSGPKTKSEYTNWIATVYRDKDAPFVSVSLNVVRSTGVVTLKCIDPSGAATEQRFKVTSVEVTD